MVAIKLKEVTTNELKETISRKEILEMYIEKEPDDVDDIMMKDYVMDRRKRKQLLAGYAAELQQYLKQVEKQAAKLQMDISDANGVIKYVDSKIIERHIELTKIGK